MKELKLIKIFIKIILPRVHDKASITFNKYVSAWTSWSCVKGAGCFGCDCGVRIVTFPEGWKAKGDMREVPARPP